MEDLLQMPLPVKEMTYSVALDEIQPILGHLRSQRVRGDFSEEIPIVSGRKLDFADFSEEIKDDLRRMMACSNEIDEYYSSRIDVTERDEVARGFHKEFIRLRDELDAPDEILRHLEHYVVGNAPVSWKSHKAMVAI